MITIVDYKAGNLASVTKAFTHLGEEIHITRDPDIVAAASRIVLPGVGHFAATAALANGMRDAISLAIARGVPFLGICVGMQWLYEGSEESPGAKGLGVLPGSCAQFPSGVKSPHVGWNTLEVRKASRLLHGLKDGSFVYFTHSYRAPVTDAACATVAYGGDFAAAVEHENIFGVQFHPEKSGAAGLAVLRNFAEMRC